MSDINYRKRPIELVQCLATTAESTVCECYKCITMDLNYTSFLDIINWRSEDLSSTPQPTW